MTIQGPYNKAVIENVTIGAYWDPESAPNVTSGYFRKGLAMANVGGVYANNLTIANNSGNGEGGREDPEAYGIYIFVVKGRGIIRQFHCTNFYIQGFYRALFAESVSAGHLLKVSIVVRVKIKGREGFIFRHIVSATYLTGIHFDAGKLVLNTTDWY